jgi:hypothetical protein
MATETNNPTPDAAEKQAPQTNLEPRTHSEFDKDQPSEPAGGPNPGRYDVPPARFDDGERKPAPVERTGDDGVRTAPASSSASFGTTKNEEEKHSQATMLPGTEGKRNTM